MAPLPHAEPRPTSGAEARRQRREQLWRPLACSLVDMDAPQLQQQQQQYQEQQQTSRALTAAAATPDRDCCSWAARQRVPR